MVASPHDALVRYAFSCVEEAASLLRSVLPAGLAARVDWSSLTVAPGSFVDEALRGRVTDLLYTVQAGDESLLVYVLLEHQRADDRWMALRVLEYVMRVWARWRSHRKEEPRLPPVVPIVLYAGREPWASPTEVRDLVALGPFGEALDACVPRLRFILDDLGAAGEAAVSDRALTLFGELALRALVALPGNPDPVGVLRRWVPLLRALLAARSGGERLQALMVYVRSVSDPSDEALLDLARSIGPEAEEIMVTAADRLREDGRKQGLDEGLREGRKEGLREGLREGRAGALLQLLVLRFGAVTPEVEARVRGADEARLEVWFARAVRAESMAGVLGAD